MQTLRTTLTLCVVRMRSTSGWLLFFLIIYIILLIKALTWHYYIEHSLFFSFYSIVITLYIFSRFVLSYFHGTPPHDPTYEPSVTFVVPAKNEGDNIAETIRRFSAVDYPKEKIEVITIDDGSTDHTLAEMHNIRQELSGMLPITVIHWDQNRGKRAGMAEGVRRAKHDIVIFVDSDSFVSPSCVKHLVKYFASPDVGAVSGHTDVYNRNANLLTQMQAVRYYIAFTVYKAAESIFGSVTCCPGCCSAYRKAYLMEFLDDWLHQTFWGTRCTFGDDRSLTNFIIRKYQAVYSPNAMAYTVVPETFAKYVRQQQRWKKSWIRETFIAATFMWRKHPLAALSFYSYLFLAFSAPVVFFRAVFWYPLVTHELPIVYILGLCLMLILHGVYYRARVGNQTWILAVLNFWFHSVILMWQLPWALVTMKDSRWGTR